MATLVTLPKRVDLSISAYEDFNYTFGVSLPPGQEVPPESSAFIMIYNRYGNPHTRWTATRLTNGYKFLVPWGEDDGLSSGLANIVHGSEYRLYLQLDADKSTRSRAQVGKLLWT